MAVVLIGTLDTKANELAFVRDLLLEAGLTTCVIDVGILGQPGFRGDITREEVLASAGTTLSSLASIGDRNTAVEKAAEGVAKQVQQLQKSGKIDGVLAIGGSAGTTLGTRAMRSLPYGIPKIMVSTLASGQVAPYVGVSDILMMHSVLDICGLNRFTRMILHNAAEAMVGMIRVRPPQATNDKPLIGATMFGVTTPCVSEARKLIEAKPYEVLVFHATGTGGLTMENMIKDGLIKGVLDLTTTELADELVGGILSAGRDRLTAAAIRGIPQVISVGALDMVNFGPRNTVPEKFANRRFHQHNPTVTLMRTTPEENDQLGKEIAEKTCASRGPTTILLPMRGISAIDRVDGPFWWPEADQALFQSIHNWSGPQVKIVEVDAHINDPVFAEVASSTLLKMLG